MLSTLLKRAQVKTSESKYFLPFDKRDEILTDDKVRECISQAHIDLSWKEHCIQAVLRGGRSLLALLILCDRVDLLVAFLETTQSLPSSQLDSRLPLDEDALKRITQNDKNEVWIDIHRRQWEVTVPVFHVGQPHWSCPKDMILPFTETKPIGHGAFGEVFAVKLPKGHHGFDVQQNGDVSRVRSADYLSLT